MPATKITVLCKGVVHKDDYKNRGSEKGGKYLMRVVTGTDKDGSPQYRYLRTPEEVAAYRGNKDDKKITHEKQAKETKDNKQKLLVNRKKDKRDDKEDDDKDKDDDKKKDKKKKSDKLVVAKRKTKDA
jgi:hypothetical protein